MRPFSFSKLSVKHKSILLIFSVVASTLMFFSVLSIFNYSYSLREAMVERVKKASGLIAVQSITGLSVRKVSESGLEVPATLRSDPAVETAVVYDPDNVAVLTYLNTEAVTDPVLPERLAKNEDTFFLQNGKMRFQFFYPIQFKGKHLGTLSVLFNTNKLINYVWRTIFFMVLCSLLSLGGALLVAVRLQKLNILPVLSLTGAVRKIIELGDFSMRVEPSSQEGIGDLITDFNMMLEVIQDREEELKESYQNSGFFQGQRIEEGGRRQGDATVVMNGKNKFPALVGDERRRPLSRLVDNHMSRIFSSNPSAVPLIGKALLVDDEPINRKVVVAILEQFGLEMEVAKNGIEAVQMVKANHYSLVFMDIQMPEMSGFEATKIIRSLEKKSERKRATIIAMTANDAATSRRKSIEAGMDDFLAKPIKLEILIERIAHWMGRAMDQTLLTSLKVEQEQPRNLPGQEVWSRTRAFEFVGGDEALFLEIATVFIGRNDLLLQNIETAIAHGNADELLESAHAYKGSIGYFASPVLRQSALALENLAKKGEVSGVNDHLVKLRKNSQLLCNDLFQIVSEANNG